MKHSIPFTAIFLAVIICTTLIVGIYFYEKFLVKENQIVQYHSEAKKILAEETDINHIISSIEAIPELKHFTGLVLLELSANEDKYVSYFESRYPRYKAYNDMHKELARGDFSPWIASVINGDTNTEFDAEVFAFIAVCKNDWYLNQVIFQFNNILKKTNPKGFAVRSPKDAYIIGALALYIMRFPGAKTAGIKNEIGKHIENFIDLTDTINGIPLNQLYIVLYLRYYSLENLITKKMNSFLESGKKSWDGVSWPVSVVQSLIDYFIRIGEGISQNFYILFRTGFYEFDPMRLYIGLEVIKKIGFDDPKLRVWLDMNYSPFENTLSIYTTTREGIKVGEEKKIIFSDEVADAKRAITGKSETPFAEALDLAVSTSVLSENFFIPEVTASDEIKKEIKKDKNLYDTDFIDRILKTWEAKHLLLLIVTILCLIAALICILPAGLDSKNDIMNASNLLTWVPFWLISLLQYIVFWNNSTDYNVFPIVQLFVLAILGGIPFFMIYKSKALYIPGKEAWRALLLLCAEIYYFFKMPLKAEFYYTIAGRPFLFYKKRVFNTSEPIDDQSLSRFPIHEIKMIVRKLISKKNQARAFEVLDKYNNSDLLNDIVSKYRSSFSSIDPMVMKSILKDSLEWITWLKKENQKDILNAIREKTMALINNIQEINTLNDNEYYDLIAGLFAFDNTTEEQRSELTLMLTNIIIKRTDTWYKGIPEIVCKVIDRASLSPGAAMLMLIVQNSPVEVSEWALKRLKHDAEKNKSPNTWFAELLSGIDKNKLQTEIKINTMLDLIDIGFIRCTECLPVYKIAQYLYSYINNKNVQTSRAKYRQIINKHKAKIDKVK